MAFWRGSVSEIFVALVGEGTSVWRAVHAIEVQPGVYEISRDALPAADELWEFQPGERIHGERRTFSDGSTGLVAVKRATPAG